MTKIDFNEFLLRQPSCPKSFPTDTFYLAVANRILELWSLSNTFKSLDESIKKRVALGITGYFQDILSDAGLWRSFIIQMKDMYGRYLPFYKIPEYYVEAELNQVDIQFLIWYTIAMLSDENRLLSPLNKDIANLASDIYSYLNSIYDDAPEPEGYNLACELDLSNQEHAKAIFEYGTWLFMHSYLLTPAFALSLASLAAQPGMIDGENASALHQRIEQAMFEDPTGPIALFLRDWIFLTIEGKLPPLISSKDSAKIHPLYSKVIEASGGSPIIFFNSYKKLNEFFISVLGWNNNEDHLPALKERHDFAIYVTPNKGMLVASDVCKCIAHSDNNMYDKEYAKNHAFEFLTIRGRCPADLGKFLTSNGFLPDAVFPELPDNHQIVDQNSDFIMRCYLQNYYTD